MNPAFDWLWETTWQASLLVLLVLAAQRVFRRWLTAEWRDVLWWLVVIRLCLPALPESSFSVFNVVGGSDGRANVQPLIRGGERERVDQTRSPLAHAHRHIGFSGEWALPVEAAQEQPAGIVNWGVVLKLVWLIGAVATFGLTAGAYWRLRRRIVGTPEVTSGRLVMLLASAQRAMNVRRPVRLLESEEGLGPALVGLWRPRLVIPKGLTEDLSDEELRHVFLHECGHLRRFDLGINWLLALLQAVHWFNPVLWWAFRRMRADRELACDELTMRSKGADSIAYGETIVRLLERAMYGGKPGLVGIVEKHADVRERISMIAVFHRSSRWSIVAVTLMFALGLTMLTDATHPAAAPEIARSPVIVSETGTGIMRADLLERVENLVWRSREREQWARGQTRRSETFGEQVQLWQKALWFHVRMRDRILRELNEQIVGDEDRFRLLERERGLWQRQFVRLCRTNDLSPLRRVAQAVQSGRPANRRATDADLIRVAESLQAGIAAIDSGQGQRVLGMGEVPADLREWRNSVVALYGALVSEVQTMTREARNGRLCVHEANETAFFMADAREQIAVRHFHRAESLLAAAVQEDPRRFLAYALRRTILERRMDPLLYPERDETPDLPTL